MMAGIEDQLTETLYRTFCPDPTELGEYHLEMLPGERVKFIKQHLSECPHCTRELNQLRSYLADVGRDLEYSPADRLKIWIARLAPEAANGTFPAAPQFAVRGGPGNLRIYQAGEARLTLDLQDDPAHPGLKAFIGLVTGVEPEGWGATLRQAGRQVAWVEVDDLGNFRFSALEPGRYELALQGPEIEIRVEDLEV
jgi:hypothetical protein